MIYIYLLLPGRVDPSLQENDVGHASAPLHRKGLGLQSQQTLLPGNMRRGSTNQVLGLAQAERSSEKHRWARSLVLSEEHRPGLLAVVFNSRVVMSSFY